MTRHDPPDLLPLLRHIADRPDLSELYRQAVERLTLGPADYAAVLELCRLTQWSSLGAHALLICMFIALEEGNSCLPLTDAAISRRLARFLEGDLRERVAEVLVALEQPQSAALLADNDDRFKPLVRERGPGGEMVLYFQRHHAQALRLKQALRQRLAQRAVTLPWTQPNLAAAIDAVLRLRPVRLSGGALTLNDEQQRALLAGLSQNTVLVSGGPGTGKTAVVGALVRGWLEAGITPARIALAAPTGRAARRLTDALRRDLASLPTPTTAETAATDLAGSTLHRLLEFDRAGNHFRRHRFNPLAVDAVVVDEVSMIDVRLMAALLEATPETARLVLIGDPEQLPPVDVGEVLADLISQAPQPEYSAAFARLAAAAQLAPPPVANGPRERLLCDRVVRLERNYRASPALQRLAAAVRAGHTGEFVAIEAGPPDALFLEDVEGGQWLPADDPQQPAWPAIVDRWLRRHYLTAGPGGLPTYFQRVEQLQARPSSAWSAPECRADWQALFAGLEAARILTAVRQGPFGCETLNRYLQQRLQHMRGHRRYDLFFPGLPILVTENDPDGQLYNGDVGLWMVDSDGLRQVVFIAENGIRQVPETALPAVEPAFAMTIHKSQGSEFDRVLVVLPADPTHRLLRRELLYTAVTRARRAVFVYGAQPVLQAAVTQTAQRETAGGWLWTGDATSDEGTS